MKLSTGLVTTTPADGTGLIAEEVEVSSADGVKVPLSSLVRSDRNAGHGINGTRDQVYAERADVWAFMLAAMGDPELTAR